MNLFINGLTPPPLFLIGMIYPPLLIQKSVVRVQLLSHKFEIHHSDMNRTSVNFNVKNVSEVLLLVKYLPRLYYYITPGKLKYMASKRR